MVTNYDNEFRVTRILVTVGRLNGNEFLEFSLPFDNFNGNHGNESFLPCYDKACPSLRCSKRRRHCRKTLVPARSIISQNKCKFFPTMLIDDVILNVAQRF